MRIENIYLNSVITPEMTFSKDELFSLFLASGYEKGKSSFLAYFQELIRDSVVQRVGRNAYQIADRHLRYYVYSYSERAVAVATAIQNHHPYLDFSIFEMIQLNEFVNHQIGRNTIFVFVDADVLDYVFDSLRTEYTSNILLSPSNSDFHRYKTDDTLVLCRRISESPMGKEPVWSVCIEKLLVDIVTEPLIISSFADSETARIYESAFEKYIIDESRMFRYARRRNAVDKIMTLISEKTNIQLHVQTGGTK